MSNAKHARKYYWSHREEVLRRAVEYRKNNLEKFRLRHAANHLKHKAKNNAYSARYLAEHREAINARKRRYYASNKERILRARAEERINNLDAFRAHGRAKYWKNPEKGRIACAAYAKKYPEKCVARVAKRRARMAAVRTSEDAATLIFRLKNQAKKIRCHWCGRRLTSSTLEIDHIIPISKGGAHEADNLCASCKSCNTSKGDRALKDWHKKGQQILPLEPSGSTAMGNTISPVPVGNAQGNQCF